MKEIIKHSLVGAILTFVVTAILQYFILFIGGDDGKIMLVNNELNDDTYQTIVALKNMSSDEYLRNVEIKVNDDIEILSVNLDGREIEINSKIIFDDINPDSISAVQIISEQYIDKDDLIIIKNESAISIEEFNKTENYKLRYLIIVFLYAIVNFVIGIWFEVKSFKEYAKTKSEITKEYDEMREENNKTLMRISEIEKDLEVSNRKLAIKHTIYIKELNQLEKENQFLKDMLLKKFDGILSEDKLEELLIKEMKRLSKKNIHYLTYDDVYNLIEATIKE